MNKKLKDLAEEYYKAAYDEDFPKGCTLIEWILNQYPNKTIKITAEIWEGSNDRLNNILDNMTDDELDTCEMTLEELIKEDILMDDELSLNIKSIDF